MLWHFIIPFMAANSLINIVLFIIVTSFTIIERAKYHTNYTAIRLQFYFASAIFCLGTFLESLAVGRIKFYGEVLNLYDYDANAEESEAANDAIPARYYLLTGSAMHIQMTSIPFVLERAFATFYSRNYETRKEFLVLVPIFAISTSAVAWSFGFTIVYMKFSITITLIALITLNFVAYVALLFLNSFNRRLSKILTTGLSQRYQVMENKRVIERLKVLFILDTVIHAWALIASVTVHVFFATHENFTDSIVSYCMLMNVSLTMMQIFTIRYSIKKHLILRRIFHGSVVHAQVNGGRSAADEEISTVSRKLRIQEEADHHFVMLNDCWK